MAQEGVKKMKRNFKKLTSVIVTLAMALGMTVKAEQTESDVLDLSDASKWKWEYNASIAEGTQPITTVTEDNTEFMRVAFPATSNGGFLWGMPYIRAQFTGIEFDPAKDIVVETRVRVGDIGVGKNIQLRYNMIENWTSIYNKTAYCVDGVSRTNTVTSNQEDLNYLTLWEMGSASSTGTFKVTNGIGTLGTGSGASYATKLADTGMAVAADTWFVITTTFNNNGYVDFAFKNEATGETVEMNDMLLNFLYGDSLTSLEFISEGEVSEFDVDYVTVKEVKKESGDEEYYYENFSDSASNWTNQTNFGSPMTIGYGRDIENAYMTVTTPKLGNYAQMWDEPYIRLVTPGIDGTGIDLNGDKTVTVKSKVRIDTLGGNFEMRYNLPYRWNDLVGSAMTDDNGKVYCGDTSWASGQAEQNLLTLWYIDSTGKLYVTDGDRGYSYLNGKFTDTGITLDTDKWYTVETYFNDEKSVTIAFYDENGERTVFANKALSFIKGTKLSSLEFYASGVGGSVVDVTDVEVTGGDKIASDLGVYLDDSFDEETNDWTVGINTTPLASAVNSNGYMTVSTAAERGNLGDRQLWLAPYVMKNIEGQFGGGVEFTEDNDILIRTRLQKKDLAVNDIQLRYNIPDSNWQKYYNKTVTGADGEEYTYAHINNNQYERDSLILWKVEASGELYVTDGITTDMDITDTEYKKTKYAVSDMILNDTDWYTIDTLLHYDGTVSVTVTNDRTGASDALLNKQIGFKMGEALTSLAFFTNASLPEVNIDYVKVENIKAGTYVMGKDTIDVSADGTVLYDIYGDYDEALEVKIIRALYLSDGTLVDVDTETKTAAKNKLNEFTMPAYTDEIPEGAYFKAFLWNGDQNPLLKADSSTKVYAVDSIVDENGNYLSADDGELKIAYIGGSITAGDSDFEGTGLAEESIWVNRVSNYFAEKFPNKTVKTYNAGLGGTQSSYGSIRFQNAVLDYEPDIVFVEFTVNDMTNASSREYQQTYIERMIRMCKKAQKEPVFIYIHVQRPIDETNASYENHLRCIEWKNELTSHYGIKTINLQEYLIADFEKAYAEDNTLTFMSYISKYYNSNGENSYDVHPKTEGHKFMAESIVDAIEKDRAGTFKKIDDVAVFTAGLTEPVYNFITADDERITYSEDFTVYTAENSFNNYVSAEVIPDWQYVYPSFPGGIAQTKNVNGAELSFTTKADYIYMSYIATTVGNSATVYVDGVNAGTLSCYDPSYTGMNYLSNSVKIADDGEEHEVKIVVNDVTDESYLFRFGAIIECFN